MISMLMPPCSPFPEQGYFILITAKQPANIFMVGKHYQAGGCYGKEPVAYFRLVKDEEYK